jgi:adenosine deaminase
MLLPPIASLQFRLRSILLVIALLLTTPRGGAQRKPLTSNAHEVRAAAEMEQARTQGPLALGAFLYAMPKGGDLHSHLSGAVYAETWLRDAVSDEMCVNASTLSLMEAPMEAAATPHSSADLHHAKCAEGTLAAAELGGNQHLYDQLVDAFSMRTFVPVTANSGHDHFFATFDHFGGVSKRHMPEWVDEVAGRAAGQNEQYVELMQTPAIAPAIHLAQQIGYQPDFAAYRARMLQADGFSEQVRAIREEMDQKERERRQMEHCDETAGASSGVPVPACQVAVRYLFQVLRNMPREAVFAQILLGLEVAAADLRSPSPHYVGINLVQPEDWYYSMADYQLHMQMIAALRAFYPQVKVALHAGELAPGMVPPAGLTFHVRSAVEVARAERIGHGVDIMYENDPDGLLREMSARHVLVEINLTSNDVILNVKGDEHPLTIYRRYHVPLALSTDDEGVSRIDLTHEYARAAETYHLSYFDLKEFARNSMEYSFLPGVSLWLDHDYRRTAEACRSQLAGSAAKGGCASFLAKNERAKQQWELERRFQAFETQQTVLARSSLQP